MDWNDYDAALFDLDGVLTPTAEVHMRAWRALFVDFLTKRGFGQPYAESDYFDYIDGKPRYDGVRSFLASRGITLPEGDPSDDPRAETVCGLGNRKNEFFAAVLRDEGVQPYPGSVALLDFLNERGTKIAVVSSSRNAPPVLEAAGLRRPVRCRRRRQRGGPRAPRGQAGAGHVRARRGTARRPGGAVSGLRGRSVGGRGRAEPVASAWWSVSTAGSGPTG